MTNTRTTYQPDLFTPAGDAAFDAWVHSPAGAEIANRFIRVAIGLKRRGFQHFGAKAIAERLRWHYQMREYKRDPRARDDYKINNNHLSRLARKSMDKVPELTGFFETRELKG